MLDAVKRGFQIGDEGVKRPRGGALPRDQHIVGSGSAAIGQDPVRDFPQSPFCPVADHGIADFPARGEPDSDAGRAAVFLRSRRRLQNQSRSGSAAAGSGNADKIGAKLEPTQAGDHSF